MAPTDLRELIAKEQSPALKVRTCTRRARAQLACSRFSFHHAQVSGESKPQSVARAIQHVIRESSTHLPPSLTAIGPQAINQAIKAIAIARRQVHAEGTLATGDLTVRPVFEGGLREGASVELVLDKTAGRVAEAGNADDALSAKPSTDAFKLAGAIAGRLRESKTCSVQVKGAVPVLIAVKAIAKAQEYLAADAGGAKLSFVAALVDRENRDLRNAPTSTFTQLSITQLPATAPAA
jgi:stage V sporulation protein SpoVS